MTTRIRRDEPRPEAGLHLGVQRGVAVDEERETGDTLLRFYDDANRPVDVRLSPTQFETLAIGVVELAKARHLLDEVN